MTFASKALLQNSKKSRSLKRDQHAARAVAAGLETWKQKGTAGHILDECCQCGIPIIYRPEVPTKPKKICMKCAVDRMTLDAQ
jgi:hypothetical protein